MELVALDLLAHADEPVGSVRMAEALVDAGINVAEATAGRYLRKLDRDGLTFAISTKGRLITPKGQERLAELRLSQRQDERRAQLAQAIKTTEVDEVVDLLYVRRAVEPEAARLAASRATNGDLERISTVDSAYVQDWKHSETRVSASLTFHRLVARASHNQMLMAVAMMLLDEAQEPLPRLLDRITMPFDDGSTSCFALQHHAVLDALRSRSPEAAEVAMRAHIDQMIAAVHRRMKRTGGTTDSRPSETASIHKKGRRSERARRTPPNLGA